MKIHQLSVSEALASVRSSAQGLVSADAAARLAEYGPNRVEPLAREHWALRLLKEFTHLFSVILWVAAGLAFLADWYDPGEGMARVGMAVGGDDLLYRQATTACLSAIVLLQIVNVFLCRSALRSVFTTGLTGNRLILWGVWLFLLPWAAGMVAIEETRKFFARRRLSSKEASP